MRVSWITGTVMGFEEAFGKESHQVIEKVG